MGCEQWGVGSGEWGNVVDRRLYIVMAALAVIVALCVYASRRNADGTVHPPLPPPTTTKPAPQFELYDQKYPSETVRLAAYLGRHRVLVVFFDGKRGADQSPLLSKLRDVHNRMQSQGVYVLAISTALPQENRKTIARAGAYPFPLLSDPGMLVHREWGRYDAQHDTPLTGVFLVDRAGRVAWSTADDHPQSLDDPDQLIERLVSGM